MGKFDLRDEIREEVEAVSFNSLSAEHITQAVDFLAEEIMKAERDNKRLNIHYVDAFDNDCRGEMWGYPFENSKAFNRVRTERLGENYKIIAGSLEKREEPIITYETDLINNKWDGLYTLARVMVHLPFNNELLRRRICNNELKKIMQDEGVIIPVELKEFLIDTYSNGEVYLKLQARQLSFNSMCNAIITHERIDEAEEHYYKERMSPIALITERGVTEFVFEENNSNNTYLLEGNNYIVITKVLKEQKGEPGEELFEHLHIGVYTGKDNTTNAKFDLEEIKEVKKEEVNLEEIVF